MIRVIEGVFTKLVDWADAALETSSNQPNLPYAVIVLNASDSNPEDYWWDVETSTRKIISGLDQERTVDKNPTFIQYAEKWRERGHIIETVEQLMKIYYSSIQVSLRSQSAIFVYMGNLLINFLPDNPCSQSGTSQTSETTGG